VSENVVPNVRVGRRTAQTMLDVTEKASVEIGKHSKTLWVDHVLLEYELEPEVGFWCWTTVTVFGYWGNGEFGSHSWKYGTHEVPYFVRALVYTYVPQYRIVRSQK